MRIQNNLGKLNLSYLAIFIVIISITILFTAYAQEIKYCGNGISICSESAPGKGEAGDGTMDSCADGTEADTLAYVKNLTIRDLNNSKFFIGDTVEITGLFGCSASNDGFRAAFAYNYGNYSLNSDGGLKNWTTLITSDCDVNADVNVSVNLTLASVVGNHTIRGLITYKYKATLGCSVPTNLTCGSEHEDATDCFSSRWSETDDITFLVLDNQVPNVTLKYPVNNTWAARLPISFNFTSTDNLGAISNCTLFANFSGTFQANATIRLPANNSNQNISARPNDGNYIWNIECVDNSTNSNFSVSNFTINVDTTFPNVTFVGLTPANNSFQSSRTVTLNVSINESNNASVILNWNGSNSTTLNNAFSIYWNITNSSLNGTYSVYVFVNDSAGNANTTLTRQFTIDPVAPSNFNLSLPRNNSVAGSAANLSPLLNWTPTTEDNFKNYTIEFSNLSNFSIINRTFVTTGNVANNSFQITQNLDNNVTWYWRVIAYDKASNSMNSTQTFVFITNTSEPSVILNYPPNNYISKFTNLSFNYTPSDDNLQRCNLVANFSGTWAINQTEPNPVTIIINNLNVSGLIDGIYIWNVNCSDTSGLTAFATANFTLKVDLTFPKVEFLSPTPANNTAQSATSLIINISVNESNRDTIILSFNGTNDTGAFTNDFSIYWSTTEGSLDGTYDFYVFVNDTAGNSNTTETRRVTVDSLAPTIANETARPRGANNNTLFNITAAITDNFNVNSTIAEVEKPGSTKENLTMNRSSGDIYSATFNGTTNGTFSVLIYANDSVNNRRQSSRFNFTVDITQPVITNINYTPSKPELVDPNVSINVSATVTDNFLVDVVLILYKKDTGTTWSNTTASNVSSLYWGNFTPNSEANWSFAVWANDTSGNINISENTTINVIYDYTWNISPNTLGLVGAVKGTNNVVLGNVTINNTGDFNQTFILAKKSGVPDVSFNISAINVSNQSLEVVRVSGNAPSTAATYNIDIYINSTNLSASPKSRVINVTFSVTEGGPFLFLEIVKADASLSTSEITSVSAKLTNTGNDTCINGLAEWTLPSDWTILAGLTGEKNISIGDISIGASTFHNLTVKVGSSTGTQTLTIAGNCSNGVNSTASTSVTVSGTGGDGGSSSGGSSGGGGGGGGGGSPGNIKSSYSQVYATITAGSSFSLEIDKADIGFTKITISVNKELNNVGITLSSLTSKPVTQAAAASVYQYLELTKNNILEADVNRVTISFRIPKSWLIDNELLPIDISLYRHELNQWNELSTKIINSDENYIFYEADSPGFSFFAIATKPGIELGISLGAEELIEIVRGQNKSYIANITNTKINTTLLDLKSSIEGFPATQINILPAFIEKISYNETKFFNITINIPSYIAEKKYPIRLLVTGKRKIGEDLQDILLFKNITLLVFKTQRAQVEYCLVEAEKELEEMKLKGFEAQKVNAKLQEAKKSLNELDYGKSKETCDEVRSLNSKALKANDEINSLSSRIKNLKDKGYDTISAEKALQLAIEAFNNGDFEKAENLIEELKVILALQVKAEEAKILSRLKKFVVNYWWVIIVTALFVTASGILIYRRYSVEGIKNRIRDLENEEKSLLQSIKKVQNEYFTDKALTKGMYDRYMDKYKLRLAEVKQEIVSLKATRIGLLRISQSLEGLENEKREINELIKDLQKKYFEEKIVDKNFYYKIMHEYKNRIAEIDKKIFLLEEKGSARYKKEEKVGVDYERKQKINKYFEKLFVDIFGIINLIFEKIKISLKEFSRKEMIKDHKKTLVDSLKGKFQLSKVDEDKLKGKQAVKEKEEVKKLDEHEHVKPNIISKSDSSKQNILRHLKEVYKNER